MTADDATTRPPAGLSLPYCDECQDWRIAARQFCARHPGRPLGSRRLSGRGSVFSFTVSHVAMSGEVAGLLPYTVVLVATDEGPRLLAHYDGEARPRIGAPVLMTEAAMTEDSTTGDSTTGAGDPGRGPFPGAGSRVARLAVAGETAAGETSA